VQRQHLTPAAARATLPPGEPAPASELREAVEWYAADRAAVLRRYDDEHAPERRERLRAHVAAWRDWLDALDHPPLGPEGRLDAALLGLQLEREAAVLDLEDARAAEAAPFLPAAPRVHALHAARRRLEDVSGPGAAETLAAIAADTDAARAALVESAPRAAVALRAAGRAEGLRLVLAGWYEHFAGYDPDFTWWAAAPYRAARKALGRHAASLREAGGVRGRADDPVVGDPVGEAALAAQLRLELIPYSPEELIRLAEREFAWCEAEMARAVADLGCADWAAALEHVKTGHVAPGRQPGLVRDLALEAVEFLRSRDLLTIPPLAEEVWRLEMMSAADQRVNPFFLGGERIIVSFPTEKMSHEEKRMSLRGNNPAFARATVQHELVPGHHLQGFMLKRCHPHRGAFGTPFWIEGWALYWEMRLWELGFPRTAEERVGMLFWRSHRAARVLFSLRFHLGEWSAEECVRLLVERIGHEAANAAAEVRRSFNGDYSPLYQLAYLIGGLQFRALHREVVEGGRMSERAFHDGVLAGNQMPVAWVRARLLGLAPETAREWRFAGGL